MTEREKQFCQNYAANPNGAEAARAAGYSAKSARVAANRLLTKAYIQDFLRELQQKAEADRVATATEAKEVLTEILRDPEAKHRDRIRAGETLLKSAGEMGAAATRNKAEHDPNGVLDFTEPEQSAGELKIMLPWNGQAPANAVQSASGKIYPLHGAQNAMMLFYVPADLTGNAVFFPFDDDEQSWLENPELLQELEAAREKLEKESENINDV